MIKITKAAAKEFNRIFESKAEEAGVAIEDFTLRVGVCGGGCSGFEYTLDLTTDAARDNDEKFESNGVKIIVDNKSHIYLDGTEIDFQDELMGRGFVFNNPNACSKCSCGQSFCV